MENVYLLPEKMSYSNEYRTKLEEDYNSLLRELPVNLEKYILERYRVDISSTYANKKIKNPFGKASGQLSTNLNQVKKDVDAGLGFIVLKTVIAQDRDNNSEMDDWKVDAPWMKVEKIVSRSQREGWTVTWKGRGWSKSFEDYLIFLEQSLKEAKSKNILVIPSSQYHLPDKEKSFNESEYEYTTNKLLNSWKKIYPDQPMILEQDFSPTLLDNTLKNKEQFFYWLDKSSKLIKKNVSSGEIVLGQKLLNAPYSEKFQIEMLKYIFQNSSADWVTCFNRLFDPDKEFRGKKGVTYGGFDLSDRNLKVLTKFRKNQSEYGLLDKDIPISATGNIESGKMMIEYALRGCKNGQIHTYFQLPTTEYMMKKGSHTEKALHELLFNPDAGLLASMLYIGSKYGLQNNNIISFESITELYKTENILG